MYVIMQTKFKPSESTLGNYVLGIASKTKCYRNLNGPIESIGFDELAKPLKDLLRSELQEVNVGFYLILE